MSQILLIHGPNLNLLGSREPDVYGHTTLNDVNSELQTAASQAGISLDHIQSNAEHVLVDAIHAAKIAGTQFIIINPAAFTHTSVAIRDALAGVAIPFIEVHISNVHARESFRHHSYFSDIADAVICGLGTHGYRAPFDQAVRTINS